MPTRSEQCNDPARHRAISRARVGRHFLGQRAGELQPGPQAIWVDYRNAARPPLLFISGGEDHLMPPVVQHSNAAHYTTETLTEVTAFGGRSHLLPAQRGWEEIADYALSWAERQAQSLADRGA